MKNQEELIAQANTLVTMGEQVLATESSDSQAKSMVNEQKFHDFRISALSFLGRVFGELSPYYQGFRTEVTHHTSSRTRRGVGMLTAAKRELQGDWLVTAGGAISRDILLDMLRLATQHSEQGNPWAAAVIAGAILEKHLRMQARNEVVSHHKHVVTAPADCHRHSGDQFDSGRCAFTGLDGQSGAHGWP